MNITRPATGLGWFLAIIVAILVIVLLVFSGIGAPAWLPLALLGLLAVAIIIG
jgi:hypothetical protein